MYRHPIQSTLKSFALIGVLLALAAPSLAQARPPQLVLHVTIDQLRGDWPTRIEERLGTGGFRYLMSTGLYYTNAHYDHSTTFTAVGHATLATGGEAAQHGLAGNDWYDAESESRVYCVEDDRHHILGQEPKAHRGTSPRNLTSSTIGDEIKIASGGDARVFSVSIKDRGAILPGGHLGKAFWYSKGTGEFVTSTYYYDEYPDWVAKWNAEGHADRYRGEHWELLHDRATYIHGDQDDRAFEKAYYDLGRTFPHPLDNPDDKSFYSGLRFTPMGDQLSLDFVEELIDQEAIGQRDTTDYLAVSFSATDYIGHAFGPESLEAEDNLLHLDRTLAELLRFVDDRVGLENTLIVLSSDHGVDAAPEYSAELGYRAGRLYPERFLAAVNEALGERFDTDRELVSAFWNPSLYLDLDNVETLDLDVRAVERALVEEILKIDGVAMAMTRTQVLNGDVTDTAVTRKIQKAFHPTRSGNVLFIQDQFWYLYPSPEKFTAMHGSPYGYDTYVPIIIAGPGIEEGTVSRRVDPADIAPTIAAALGIKPPSGAIGTPLTEVIEAMP
ncbi:MAG: alkaline phosphatase family protein [Gemmatimonadetes bacterium]|nr:alkaline phosphatase family protein [Gemmatimonadota bacterium]NIS01542.1 alkaline phosphatase family protein [Gemmatimonadota bacterium]NIW75976.1 alkaline phosphatase family protein [Gemmatimonadota bacterium]